MFGKSLDLGLKRDVTGAIVFFITHLIVAAGISTVLVHFMGLTGLVGGGTGGSFFAGGGLYDTIGTLFVLWLGGSVLSHRGLTSDIMSIVVVMIGLYLSYTTGIIMGLVPIALLTTMGK